MTEGTDKQYDLFISYADADRAWVEGYLLDALTQAGARALTEQAFALGVPRLLEFERALGQSGRTLLVLSPAYLVESLGQFVDLLAQSYGLESATWPVIPLVLQPVQLPPRLAMLTALDATDPEEWAAVVERLCAELQRPTPAALPRPPCPYPGMVPFSEADSHRFFGRDEETQALLERLRLHPFLTVIGPSGSGKSSLVFAGLVPALRHSGLFSTPGGWLARALRPGERPLQALAAALDGDPQAPQAAVSDLLAARPDAERLLLIVDQFEETFALALQDADPFQHALAGLAHVPDCYVVLTARADFYADLMACPLWQQIQHHRLEVLPMDEHGLRQAILRPAEDVGVFVETALVERLVADAAGEPGVLPLVQETLVLLWEKVERRYLPLRAYEALVLPRRAYVPPTDLALAPHTGLQMAIARRADAALAALSSPGQALARRIFLRLVQFGVGRADTRRQLHVRQLRAAGDDPALFDATLTHLADRRLLTLSGAEADAGPLADIAHEALIEGWPTLRRWLAQRREAEQTRRTLETKAAEWVRLGKESGGLLDEVELLEAQRWLSSPDAVDLGYGEDLTDLVAASRSAIEEAQREREAARQRELELERRRAQEQANAARRFQRVAIGLAVVFLLAVGAAVLAGISRQQARNEADQRGTAEAIAVIEAAEADDARATAEARRLEVAAERDRAEEKARIALSRQLALQATIQLESQLDLALLLSVEAYRISDTAEARQSLLTGVQYSPRNTVFLHGHASAVNSVAFTGTLVASGGEKEILLWDVSNPRSPVKLDALMQPLSSVVLSPDGKTLAAGSEDGTIDLWDVSELRSPARLGSTPTAYQGDLRSVVFSPDGTTLASGYSDESINLWDVSNPRSPMQIGSTPKGYQGSMAGVMAFSADGTTLAAISGGGTIILWDLSDPMSPTKLGSPLIGLSMTGTGSPTSVAFSPDRKILASGYSDGSINLWDVSTPVSPASFFITPIFHCGIVGSVAFSPDGTVLASGSSCKTIILWSVSNPSSPTKLAAPLTGHTSEVSSVAFNPEGKTLASGDSDGNIILWNTADLPDPPQSPLQLDWTLSGQASYVRNLAFSPDGKIGAAIDLNGTITLWDMSNPESPAELGSAPKVHAGEVYCAAFSADSNTLASGDADGNIVLWDISHPESPLPLGPPLSGHTSQVLSVTFSPDGKTLASGDFDGNITLWDVSSPGSPVPLGSPLGGRTTGVLGVVFSPDGKTLASGGIDRNIILWDVTNPGSPLPLGVPLSGHKNSVRSVAISPDGRTLASSGYKDCDDRGNCGGCEIILWDVSDSRFPVKLGSPLTSQIDAAHNLAFSPDSKTLTSFSESVYAVLWSTDAASWKASACLRANRNLTQEEWARFFPDQAYRETCTD